MTDEVSVTERLRKGIDEFLGSSGAGLEEVVNSKAFGDALAQLTGNLVAISRIGGETMDLLIRNARLAGRRDVADLGRQLARNEDKLEAVLALVEELQDELKAERAKNAAAGTNESGVKESGTEETEADVASARAPKNPRKTAATEQD